MAIAVADEEAHREEVASEDSAATKDGLGKGIRWEDSGQWGSQQIDGESF